MNPLTLVKRIQNINSREAALGISEEASWHAKYKESAYVYVGGVPYDLTEGDLLAVFSQYGEIVDVNLVRDKGTGKSKGFAFVAYEDQRSTNLAVDNLNGAQILGRIIRVDHVSKYKKKEEEDEETERLKREARGVCRAFQRGECTRGAGCKFSHDEQRAANTGWGSEAPNPKWGHDKFDDPKKSRDKDSHDSMRGNGRAFEGPPRREDRREEKGFRARSEDEESEHKSKEKFIRSEEKRFKRHNFDEDEPKSRGDNDKREENRSRRMSDDGFPTKSRKDHDKREERRPTEDVDKRERQRSKRHYYETHDSRDNHEKRKDLQTTRRDGDSSSNPRTARDGTARDEDQRRISDRH